MDSADQSVLAEQMSVTAGLSHIKRTDPGAVSATECDNCGNEIPEGRRQAMPGTKHCVVCAQEKEEVNG